MPFKFLKGANATSDRRLHNRVGPRVRSPRHDQDGDGDLEDSAIRFGRATQLHVPSPLLEVHPSGHEVPHTGPLHPRALAPRLLVRARTRLAQGLRRSLPRHEDDRRLRGPSHCR